MAVDRHPSRNPSPPRKPPPTSTTDGQPNTVGMTRTGGAEMTYGSRNGKQMNLHIKPAHKSERHSDFMAFSESKAPKAGHEEPQEGTVSKAHKPGDEK